jgi:hypothetical protein
MLARMFKRFPPMFLFALFWTALVGLFDLVVGVGVISSVRSQSFASVEGIVTSSEITTHDSDDGTTYGVDIRYAYNVNGKAFEGDTYRYSAFSSSGGDWAREAVAAHPKGARVRVYYDPANPQASVLAPGLDGADLFIMLFLTPFNVVMIGLWWAIGAPLWHRWRGTQRDSIDWFHHGGAVRVRLAPLPWIASGFAGAGAAAFVSIFIVAFTAGFHPSMAFAQTMWALTLAAGVGSAFYVRQKSLAGDYDLVIGDRQVDLPAGLERTKRTTLDKKSIAGVAVEKVEQGENNTVWEVRLLKSDGGHEAVAQWYDEEQAGKLARWLEDQIGVRRR